MNIILSIHPFIFCLSFLPGSKGSTTIMDTQLSFRCRQVQFITEEKTNRQLASCTCLEKNQGPWLESNLQRATQQYPLIWKITIFLLYVLTTWSMHRLGTGQEGQHQLVVHYSSAAVPLVFLFMGREKMRQLLPRQVWTWRILAWTTWGQ